RGAGHPPGAERGPACGGLARGAASRRSRSAGPGQIPRPGRAMSTITLHPREERRALIVLLTVIYFMIAGFGLVIPLLPFFAQAFKASPLLVTAMFSAFSV